MQERSKDWREDFIERKYQEGKGSSEIGKLLGISGERVLQLMRCCGLQRRSLSEASKIKLGISEKEKVYIDYRRGLDYLEIARNHEVGVGVIQRVLKEEGIELESSSKRRVDLKFTQSQQTDICKDYSRGLFLRRIEEKYRVTFRDIREVLNAHRISFRTRASIWNISSQGQELARKIFSASRRKPNRAESKLSRILQEFFPDEYALNVKAEIMTLGGKIPDFVNVNGQKKVIELYGDYYHAGDDPQDRIDYFKQFGYWALVVWEHELKDRSCLVQKLAEFNGSLLSSSQQLIFPFYWGGKGEEKDEVKLSSLNLHSQKQEEERIKKRLERLRKEKEVIRMTEEFLLEAPSCPRCPSNDTRRIKTDYLYCRRCGYEAHFLQFYKGQRERIEVQKLFKKGIIKGQKYIDWRKLEREEKEKES